MEEIEKQLKRKSIAAREEAEQWNNVL